MKKNPFLNSTLFLTFALFCAGLQLFAQDPFYSANTGWSQNQSLSSVWTTNPNATVGIGMASSGPQLQFSNGQGIKIALSQSNYSEEYNYAFNGFGIGPDNNMCFIIPDEPTQRFSLRLNNSWGAEKFMIVRDGSIGINGAYPANAKMQFDNALGNKISFFDSGNNVGFGLGLNNNNLSAYIPDLPSQRFSVRLNNSTGTEKFMVWNDGVVHAGRRLCLGVTGTEGGGYSVLQFKGGTSTTGGIIRSSVGTGELSNGPLGLEASTLSYKSSNGTVRLFVNSAGNVGIGTTNPTYKLSVNGTIRAKEVRVETGWADYVFDNAFALRPLAEVEQFVKENKHLPDVTPAADIQAEGLQVAKVMTEMMRKIEELTLYAIEQNKRLEKLEQENATLKSAGR